MTTQIKTTPDSVTLTRLIKAPREKVFAAWTEPSTLERWFGCQNSICKVEEHDLQAGGKYALHFRFPDGSEDLVYGSFTEVSPIDRLGFTWKWSNTSAETPVINETQVLVEFYDCDEGTEIRLTHSGFENAEVAGMHDKGWSAAFEALEKLF